MGWTPRNQTPHWVGYPGVSLLCGQDTAESDSSLGRIPWSQTLLWSGHRGVRLLIGRNTLESDSSVVRTPRTQAPLWAEHSKVRLLGGQVILSLALFSKEHWSQTIQWAGHCSGRLLSKKDIAETNSSVG